MPVWPTKIQMFFAIMVFNVAVFFLTLSWSSAHDEAPGPKSQIRIPTNKFWLQENFSKSFWNREQQRLNIIHNPIFNSKFSSMAELPDWLNETLPRDNNCKPDSRVKTQLMDYNDLSSPFQDFLLYSRCKSYPVLINQPKVCDEAPFLLLVVKSLVSHFERRQAIRETWGQVGAVANKRVATVFLLGNVMPADNLPNMTPLLRYEAEFYGDILQWDYRDTFFNLTVKDILFLEWFSSFCSGARFVFKGDDDVFVNTLRIIDFLDKLPENKVADLFTGDVIQNAGPHRDKRLKYFVPESFYVGGYPPYAGGGGFLYSGQLALRLYEASKKVVLYPIDDVYTGMCLEKLGVAPEKHNDFRTFDIEKRYKDNPCIYRTLMVVHSRTPQEVKRIWGWIVNPELHCQ